jgi:hypothetical protein
VAYNQRQGFLNLVIAPVASFTEKLAQQMSKVEALSKTFANFAATFFFQGAFFFASLWTYTETQREQGTQSQHLSTSTA